MGDKSAIEWLNGGATWNPIRARRKSDGKVGWFCTKPSPGCKNCYAERMNVQAGNNPGRMGNGIRYAVDQVGQIDLFLDEETLLQPLHWKRGRLVFPCSMTDWMAEFVRDEWRDKMLAVMALTPQHTYLTLTKRAGVQREYLSGCGLYERLLRWADWIRLDTNTKPAHIGISDPTRFPLKNNWRGVSCENQEYADKIIPELLNTPAAVRWVSAEPLLGPIDFSAIPFGWQHKIVNGKPVHGSFRVTALQPHTTFYDEGQIDWPRIDWLVVGGESGPGARPMQEEWARSIMQQCKAAGVPFFMKQMGGVRDKRGDLSAIPEDLRIREYPEAK